MNKTEIKKVFHRFWKEWRITIFFIVFVIIPAKSSLADWNWVPSGSMNPTVLEGDLVFVNKVAYDLRFPLTLQRLLKWSDPGRGDVVICFSPKDRTRLIKRVIALPGDKIEMKNNCLVLNGKPISYSKTGCDSTGLFVREELGENCHTVMSIPSILARRDFGPVKVPDDSYFVMGDNRDKSKDSRHFGFVERKAIVGKAKGVIVSFDITDKYQPRLNRFFHSLN